ncbi:hypothetical protein JL720_8977 [Aureococcus anophagefferens]|nr:hypothetical protein JL720_8977 [Aureococcus anophagefferens]
MSAVVAAKEAPPVPATKDAPPSPSKKEKGSEEKKKRRGGRANRSKKDKDKAKEADAEATKSSFDCSSAIAKVSEPLGLSGLRHAHGREPRGAAPASRRAAGRRAVAARAAPPRRPDLASARDAAAPPAQATLLECGVTAVVSTLDKSQPLETFTFLDVDTSAPECTGALHEACDFMNENIEEGGAVFIHSRSGFARSEWAVVLVVGYLVKYESVKLRDAVERLAAATKRAIAPASRFRRELAEFEEEALGEASVDEEWIEDAADVDDINHTLSRQKLAENLNDRRPSKEEPTQ